MILTLESNPVKPFFTQRENTLFQYINVYLKFIKIKIKNIIILHGDINTNTKKVEIKKFVFPNYILEDRNEEKLWSKNVWKDVNTNRRLHIALLL